MTRMHFLRGCATGAIAIGTLTATPALAAGTAAGTPIQNTVSVAYSVGGIAQTAATATDQFVVDRKVDVLVTRVDNIPTPVTPGAVNQAVSFRVENLSNATLDFELSTLQVASGSPAGITGNDSFDVTGPLTYYRDMNGDDTFNAGDMLITHLDALDPDTPVTVHVVAAAIPVGLENGALAAVTLTATGRENNNGTGLGTALTQSSGNNADPMVVDTIFVNLSGLATDDYRVLTAALAASKSSTIIAGTGPFAAGAAIPGATVEYCITVSNTGGGAEATGVTITDELPDEVTYLGAFGVRVGGANCSTPGSPTGTYDAGEHEVTGTISSLAVDTSQTLIFRATIN